MASTALARILDLEGRDSFFSILLDLSPAAKRAREVTIAPVTTFLKGASYLVRELGFGWGSASLRLSKGRTTRKGNAMGIAQERGSRGEGEPS